MIGYEELTLVVDMYLLMNGDGRMSEGGEVSRTRESGPQMPVTEE